MEASKVSVIYRSLKEDIVNMKYEPKEAINEKFVAELYGVSKTPAREALAMLVQEGYLRKYPRMGYLINEIGESEYYKLLYLRYTLEKGVVAHIIANCSDEEICGLLEYCTEKTIQYKDLARINLRFHRGMAKITHNEYLYAAIEDVFDRMIRMPNLGTYKKFAENPHQGHINLVDAMVARDLEKALSIAREECRREDDVNLWF